eukprot:5674602-Prymnesium_polylepis.1
MSLPAAAWHAAACRGLPRPTAAYCGLLRPPVRHIHPIPNAHDLAVSGAGPHPAPRAQSQRGVCHCVCVCSESSSVLTGHEDAAPRHLMGVPH